MRGRVAWAAVLAAGLGACGGDSSPTRPQVSTPTGSTGLSSGATLTVLSGATGAPVAGAAVTIGGQAATTNGAGQVRVPAAAPIGTLIDVTHPSHLDRQTSVRSDTGDRITLWPRTTPEGLDENYTSTLVYTSAIENPARVVGMSPLLRLPPATDTIVLTPSAGILADPEAMAAHEAAARDATSATGGRVRVLFAGTNAPIGGSVVVTTRVAPADSFCIASGARAYTVGFGGDFMLVKGDIVFCAASFARSTTVLHELGHAFGLGHAPVGTNDIMEPNFDPRRATTFGPRETLALRMMLDRRPGNRFPDSDRGVAASSARTERIIVCR